MHPGDLADLILDRIHAYARKHLSECRGRPRSELELLFGDLRLEVARILQETAMEDE
jgi:hypothetical protein